MIIWQGKGWVVAAIVFMTSLVANFLTDLFKGSGYYDTHSELAGIAIAFSSIFIYQFAQKSRGETTVHMDVKTGKETNVMARHALLFVDVKYWAQIVLVLGILMTIYYLFT